MTRTIGIVGLGLLGGALAERLCERGWRVVGFDVDPQRRAAAERHGVVVADDAATVVAAGEPLLLSLPDGDVAGAVLRELTPRLRAGQLIVDTTTAAPEQMIAHAESVRAAGGRFVEAEIAGSSAQARRGEVLVFAAGEPADVAACRPLLECFAAEVCEVGPTGAAAKLKLVHNLALGLHRAVLAEALVFAEALGLDPAQTLDLLGRSPAASSVMATKGPKMTARDYAPQATVRQHLKDVRLMLSAARRADVRVPLSSVHAELLERAAALGFADSDNSAVIEAWRNPRPADRS